MGCGACCEAWVACGTPVHCLAPEGTATETLSAFFAAENLAPGAVLRQAGLEVRIFPFLEQDEYDRLLWADLNLVRADSFVRGQWAARPRFWQIYPQQAGAHWPKLEAFLGLYCRACRRRLRRRSQDSGGRGTTAMRRRVRTRLVRFLGTPARLQGACLRWARQLIKNGDVANNLAQFCENLLK
jgi:uncharacterized repeat protein (TIGR03837 family)